MLLDPCRFYRLLHLATVPSLFKVCFHQLLPSSHATYSFVGKEHGKLVHIRHKMPTYCNIPYKQQNNWYLVPLCSYVIYRTDFRTLTLLNQINVFFFFQLSSPFSCTVQVLQGKKTECTWQNGKAENQQAWQSIASECCILQHTPQFTIYWECYSGPEERYWYVFVHPSHKSKWSEVKKKEKKKLAKSLEKDQFKNNYNYMLNWK